MRLLILLFSAFVTTFAVGGQAARAADGAQIAVSAAEIASAKVVSERPALAAPVSRWKRYSSWSDLPDALAPANSIPLYASRLRF